MTSPLFLDLARCARDRALLAAGRSIELAQAAPPGEMEWVRGLAFHAALHRRRYWRELAAAAALGGHPWPAAEQLGREP